MQTLLRALRWSTDPPTTALYDPDISAAACLASHLQLRGFAVERRANADDFIQAIRAGDFRAVIVAADLENSACLRFLDHLRRVAPASWLIASNTTFGPEISRLARRHGIDVLLPAPIDANELTRRLAALQARARWLF